MPSGLLIAIPSDYQKVGDQNRYTLNSVPVDTVVRVLGAVPVLVPAVGQRLDVATLLDRVDGVFIPGGLTNVHPSQYRRSPSDNSGPFDPARDATVLPLIRETLRRGIPMLLTCRGLQELNVCLGGTLRQEPDDLPEEAKHGTPKSAKSEDERYRIRQALEIQPGGVLASILGAERINVNSLHSDLVDTLAPGLVVEATADDGTIEAVSVQGAKAFALAVIFHPEYWAEHDPPSLAILSAFAAAVRDHAARRSFAAAAE